MADGVAGDLSGRAHTLEAKAQALVDERIWPQLAARRTALGVHLALLAVGAAVLVHLHRQQWFFGDEWAFLTARRGPVLSIDAWLAPHNEHMSTIPYGIYRLLLAVFGLNHYVVFALPVVAVHVACCHLVWRASVRSGATPWLATAVGAPLVLLGGGSENLLWAFQVGFVGSVAFGWGAIILCTDDRKNRQILGAVVAFLGLLFSNVTLPILVGAGLVAWCRNGFKRAVVLLGPSAVAFVLWRAAFPAVQLYAASDPDEGFVALPAFVIEEVLGSLQRLFIAREMGVLVLAGVVVWTYRKLRAPDDALPALGGVAGALFFVLVTGYGRVDLGGPGAASSRYVYILAMLLAPAIAAGLGARVLHRGEIIVIGALCFVLAGFHTGLLHRNALDESGRETDIRYEVMAAEDLVVRNPDRYPPTLAVERRYSPDLQVSDLLSLHRSGRLKVGFYPKSAGLTAESSLGVAVAPGCADVCCEPAGAAAPTGPFLLDGPGTLVIEVPAAGTIGYTLVRDGVRSRQLVALATPGLNSLTSTVEGTLEVVPAAGATVAACEP